MQSLRTKIDQAVAAAVDRVVASAGYRRYIGAQSTALELGLQQLYPLHHVMLTNSGTVALELALRAIGVEPGDQIVMSGYDYPGNFWAVEQSGCVPVLIDVCPNSVQVDLDQLDGAVTERTRAVIVSHLHGQTQPVDKIRAWCDNRSIKLIEDACQAIGAMFQDKPLGAYGHLAVLSFGGSKVLSAGRGGALITDDERLFQKAKISAGAGSGAYALSELSAAIVNAQLGFLAEINQASSKYFQTVERSLPPTLDRQFLGNSDSTLNAYYQAGWILQHESAARAAAERLTQLGITAGSGFSGFHRRSARRCRTVGELSNTASIVDRLLLIHFSAAIDHKLQPQQVAEAIAQAVDESAK